MANFIKLHLYWDPYPEVNVDAERIFIFADSIDPAVPGGLIFFSFKGNAMQVRESAAEIHALIAAGPAT